MGVHWRENEGKRRSVLERRRRPRPHFWRVGSKETAVFKKEKEKKN